MQGTYSVPVYQRLVTVVSCALFYLLAVKGGAWGPGREYGIVAALVAMACVEKLCAIMNLVSIEKDWVSTTYLSTMARIVVRRSVGRH